MAVLLWTFSDATESYTVPNNPNGMTQLKAAKNITTKVTTARDGQTLFFEGARVPQDWQFTGTLFAQAHYDALDHWVYGKGRIVITDHFGRLIYCLLTSFEPIPKGSVQHPWKHDYTCRGQVYDVRYP